jgi:hypothetical protein
MNRAVKKRNKCVGTALAAVMTAWALTGCSGPRMDVSVEREPAPAVDFDAISTYSWHAGDIAPTAQPRHSRAEIDQAVRAAVDTELQRMGLRLVAEDPDVLVGYSAAVDKDLDVSAVNLQYGYAPGMGAPMQSGPGYRRFTPGWAPPSESVRFFERGTLVLDFMDADTKELVWRVSAQAELDRDVAGPVREQRLQQAVRLMLEGFKE